MPDANPKLTKPECYKRALSGWLACAVREPDSLVTGSLLFILCGLPLLTFGPAWLALAFYMGRRGDGIKTSWREALSYALKRCGLKAWLMGWSDFLALAMACGGLLALWGMNLPRPMRFSYVAAIFLDGLYIVSGVYRYPALAREPNNLLSRIIVRGFLMTVGNLGWTSLFACAQLLLLIICAATGIGLILLYPAGAALLAHYAYSSMILLYFPEPGK